MSVQKPSYGTSVVLTTTNLQSLASSATAGWQSAAIDNAAALALAVIIRVKAVMAAGSPANDKTIYVYAYESEDGTNYTDNATGSEGTLTRRDPTNFTLLGTIAVPTSGALTYEKVFQYAPMVMPRKWGIYINNFTGVAFASAVVSYTPVNGQSV